MSRQDSLELLDDVEENLNVMIETQVIKRVKVKSMLEHLRSALEYCANDTYDKYVTDASIPRPKFYFPYGEQIHIDKFFKKTLKIASPSSSPLYAIFNSIQDIHTGEVWLNMLCNLTNEVKHRNPIPLDENEVITGLTVTAAGFGLIQADGASSIVFENNYVNGHKLADFTYDKGKLDTAENGIPLNITLTKDKKIKFHGNDYEVIEFMRLSIHRLRNFINNVYDVLEDLPCVKN
jgi:hypothetical protein